MKRNRRGISREIIVARKVKSFQLVTIIVAIEDKVMKMTFERLDLDNWNKWTVCITRGVYARLLKLG